MANGSDSFERALALLQKRDFAAAEHCLSAVLKKQPAHVGALNVLAILLAQTGRYIEAETYFRKAIKVFPSSDATYANYGATLIALNRLAEALEMFDKALAINPSVSDTWNSRGRALLKDGNLDAALADFERAISLEGGNAGAHANKAKTLGELRRFEESRAEFDVALGLAPGLAEAWIGRGITCAALRQFGEAFTALDQAITLRPDLAEAWLARGDALLQLWRMDEAIAAYERGMEAHPRDADLLIGRGRAFLMKGSLEAAIPDFEQALRISPGETAALAGLVDASVECCEWNRLDQPLQDLRALAEQGKPVQPMTFLRTVDDPAFHCAVARNYMQDTVPRSAEFTPRAKTPRDKCRIAYLSADFRQHPVAALLVSLIDQHDRARFEVTGVSFGPDDGSDLRRRLTGAFDRFEDVQKHSDREIAQRLRDLEIDIAVDLMGHTLAARPGILAFRSVPINVQWLGYAGTMGAHFIDYIIADPIVIPDDRQVHYTENVVQLPDCVLPHDPSKPIAANIPTRAQEGLPDRGFVFCCFNKNYKITRTVFDIWMRLLAGVDGSVLWLSRADDRVVHNLRAAANEHGIDSGRLIFASRVASLSEHLARHRLADLFLDTLPYNAHSTANDALWAGVPLLTCAGQGFAARVSASMLQAVNLPELVTHSLADYEAAAKRLATEPASLQTLRQKLAGNRETAPLFDLDRYRRHIEIAYQTMWQRWRDGEAPGSFRVPRVEASGNACV